jgi:PTS system cellobiose-specific IIC component
MRPPARSFADRLTRLGENPYLSAVRAGMVAVVPLTIVGGLFTIAAYPPVPGWADRVAPYRQLLEVPVAATFGLLAVFACLSIAYELGRQLRQEPLTSASLALAVFLLLQLDPATATLRMDGLGSRGLFMAILVALVAVRVQKLFTDRQLVIRLPASVPAIVSQSFLSLSPLVFLLIAFWTLRFVFEVDFDGAVQRAFRPLVFALNTLPGILTYAAVVAMLWSVGINGDNTVDAVVAPVFLQYLAANVEAMAAGRPLPYVTAYGFFTTFVNVGGTGATLALALVLWRSRVPGFRQVSRLSLPTQVFQINEPIFFGLPIVLNPVFMIPYVLNALLLTAGTWLLMHWSVINRPLVNVPWTTPPLVGHYLVSGGDWRAAVWGAVSIVLAMAVYFPFARAAERRGQAVASPAGASDAPERKGEGDVIRTRSALLLLLLLCGLVAATQERTAANTAQNEPPAYRQKSRTFHTADEFSKETQGRVTLQRSVDPQRRGEILERVRRLPLTEFTVVAAQPPGVTWIGTRRGAIRVSGDAKPVEYFAGQRWLPDDHVTAIGFDGDAVWLETPKGFSRIEYRPMTLAAKSKLFVERVQARHNRWGFTADSQLRVPGDVSTNQLVSTDNDGLWTAMYVAAEAFRYKVTGEADARDNARRGMQAIMRLESITGIPGFPARSIIKTGEDLQPKDGEWHDTPDKAWRWKGDTSSDEIVGHYFVYPIYFDLVADDAEKTALAAVIDRITNHILDNNYQLIDVDGQRTRWGWWGPDVIWDDPDETGLRALHILSHLRVAQYMTRSREHRSKFQAAYHDLVHHRRYALLTRNQKIMVPGSINHSDDELAFLSYYPLLQYEPDKAVREAYLASLERSWQIERPERNPLWNIIYAAGTGARQFDRDETYRTLREIPLDTIQWTVTNSHRLDVPVDPMRDRQKRPQALVVLPYDELPMWKWNGNPFNLDGGSGGRAEDDGAFFLLPYWMGRYHGLIGE